MDWSKLAAWHDWIAMDESGEWYAYLEEPTKCMHTWSCLSPHDMCRIPTAHCPAGYDGTWDNSKMQRPEEG